MKALIVSYLSKFLSAISMPLSGAGIYLSGKGVVDLSDAAAVDAAGTSIATGLVVIASAIISRLLGKWLTEKPSASGGTGGTSGWALLLTCAAAAGFVGALPSCATTVTRTTLPDGTVIEVTAKASDAVAIGAAVEMSRLILPIAIHAEK